VDFVCLWLPFFWSGFETRTRPAVLCAICGPMYSSSPDWKRDRALSATTLVGWIADIKRRGWGWHRRARKPLECPLACSLDLVSIVVKRRREDTGLAPSRRCRPMPSDAQSELSASNPDRRGLTDGDRFLNRSPGARFFSGHSVAYAGRTVSAGPITCGAAISTAGHQRVDLAAAALGQR
jgi:hypothetical protein